MPEFPGIPATADGSTAVVWVETQISQGACAYPITPSTNMGVGYQAEVANGHKNLWGEPLVFLEPESEHSSCTACEGFALAGGRVTNFTSGQGLILMKEVLYTISGKRLPIVYHIGARALTSQSLNVHAGHDDVMGVADTGWGMLFARNAQEAADLALIARRVAEETSTPFFVVQDGFLTTHTIESVRLPEAELMARFVGNPAEKLTSLFDPKRPLQSGVVQNQEAYMKGKIAQRFFTDRIPDAYRSACDEFEMLTGRRYGTVSTHRMEDAEYAIIGMGSMLETAEAVADWAREKMGIKVGTVHVTSFRPFHGADLVDAIKGTRAVAVLERMDNPLGQSNPLTTEVKSSLVDALTATGGPRLYHIPTVYSGSAGLGSRDVRPGDIMAALQHIVEGSQQRYFVLGIRHPLALPVTRDPDVQPNGSFALRGHSIGGFGSVTTNKILATITGDLLGLSVQAYPLYGSEKKGLPTTYYLVVAPERIRTHCEIRDVDFVSLNDTNAFNLGQPLAGLRKNGLVFLQTAETDPAKIWEAIPKSARRHIMETKARVLALDTAQIARDGASNPELQMRMQGIVFLGVFLRHVPLVAGLGLDEATLMQRVEEVLRKYFGKRGEQVVQDNLNAVKRGYHESLEIPAALMVSEPTEDAQRAPVPRERQVSDCMHRGVTVCAPEAPVREVIDTMEAEKISALVVVDEAGYAVGVISSTDLANAHFLAPEIPLDGLMAQHLMTSPVVAVHPDTPLEHARQLLRQKHIHRLVVVHPEDPDHLRPVGILSVTDLALALADIDITVPAG